MRKVAVTDKNRPKAAAADIERERAALAGQSLAEYRASRGGECGPADAVLPWPPTDASKSY